MKKSLCITILLLFVTGCCTMGKNKVYSDHVDVLIKAQIVLMENLDVKKQKDLDADMVAGELTKFQKSIEYFVKINESVFENKPRKLSDFPICFQKRLKALQDNFEKIGDLLKKKHITSLKKTRVLKPLVYIARDVRKLKRQMKRLIILPPEKK